MQALTIKLVDRIRHAHTEGRFIEFIRWPRYYEAITGYVVECARDSILVDRLNWDVFRFDGRCAFPCTSVARIHIFDESEWPICAARQLGLTKRVDLHRSEGSYPDLLRRTTRGASLVEIEQERLFPRALFLCKVLGFDRSGMRVRNYQRSLAASEESLILFRNITKFTVRSGYSNAASAALSVIESLQRAAPPSAGRASAAI